jgi:hypothetical protein
MQVGLVASSKCAGGLGSCFSMNIMVDWIRKKAWQPDESVVF